MVIGLLPESILIFNNLGYLIPEIYHVMTHGNISSIYCTTLTSERQDKDKAHAGSTVITVTDGNPSALLLPTSLECCFFTLKYTRYRRTFGCFSSSISQHEHPI